MVVEDQRLNHIGKTRDENIHVAYVNASKENINKQHGVDYNFLINSFNYKLTVVSMLDSIICFCLQLIINM